MDERWIVLNTGQRSAEENMKIDAELLDRAHTLEKPILHLYEWEGDSATFGYFAHPEKLLNLEQVNKKGLNLARRPTGGGMIFHLWDMAFSIIVPAHSLHFSLNTLDNYAYVNRIVLQVIEEFSVHFPPLTLIEEDGPALDPSCHHFCMAKPTKYDVLWDGKKIAGAAQRKTKAGFLHQGSISLVLPEKDYLQEILAPGTSVQQAMQIHTYPLLGSSASESEIRLAKEKLAALLATQLNKSSLE